jgi:hypothetical protein
LCPVCRQAGSFLRGFIFLPQTCLLADRDEKGTKKTFLTLFPLFVYSCSHS